MGYTRVGFRFNPTDEELVFDYLLRKVRGEVLPPEFVSYCDDLYSHKNPWELFDKDSECPVYVFTRLKKRKDTHSNIIRSAGSGTWKGQNKKSFRNPGRNLIWFKKDFVFEVNKKNTKDRSDFSSKKNGHWLMTEYSLEDEGVNSCVLCTIYNKLARNEKKKKKGEVIIFQRAEYPVTVNESHAPDLSITPCHPGSKRGLSGDYEAHEDQNAKRIRVFCLQSCQESYLETDNGDQIDNSLFIPSNLVAEHVNGVSSSLQEANSDFSAPSFMIPSSGNAAAPLYAEYQETEVHNGEGIEKSPFLLTAEQESTVSSITTAEHHLQESSVFFISSESDPETKTFHDQQVSSFWQLEYPLIVNESRAPDISITPYQPGSKRGHSDEHESEDQNSKRMQVCCHQPCQECYHQTSNGDTIDNSLSVPWNLVAEHANCYFSAPATINDQRLFSEEDYYYDYYFNYFNY